MNIKNYSAKSLTKVFTIVLLGQFVLLSQACETNKRNHTEEKPGREVVNSRMEPDFKGRLFTSGLTGEEAERLGLKSPVYQITGRQNYFFSGHDSLQSYLGSCIGIEGAVKEGWSEQAENFNGQFTYNRSALDVKTISLLEITECPEAEVEAEFRLEESELETFKGVVERMERPAPDIAYDYTLRLESPFRDKYHPVQPDKMIKEIPLVAFEPEQLNKLEKAVAENKTIVVQAVLKQGYAEQRVLQLARILDVE